MTKMNSTGKKYNIELETKITGELGEALDTWPNLRRETKAKISKLKDYYSNIEEKRKAEVVNKSKSDMEELSNNLKRHVELAINAKTAKDSLEIQVTTGETHVENITKKGRPTAVAVVIICTALGGYSGSRVPGWITPATIVIGALLGFIFSGIFSLVIYVIMKRNYTRNRDMWLRVQTENKESLELVSFIMEKKSHLNEICGNTGNLAVIGEFNTKNAVNALLETMDEYLQDND